MRRQARVVRTELPARAPARTPARTLVEVDSPSQCLRCVRGEGCGAAMLNNPQESAVQLWVTNPSHTPALAVVTGQQVLIEINDAGSGWLWPVFGAYGLPLLGLMLATALATAVTAMVGGTPVVAEIIVIFSALAGLCGGIIAWRQLAPGVLARAERSLCLQSARIVATYPSTERAELI